MKENRVIKDMKDRTIDRIAPDHLSTKVISGALYIHNGKDTDDKLKRTELIMKKLGNELTTYVMALLTLPQLMDTVMKSGEYKKFKDERHSSTVH